jgi:hypothetical protein
VFQSKLKSRLASNHMMYVLTSYHYGIGPELDICSPDPEVLRRHFAKQWGIDIGSELYKELMWDDESEDFDGKEWEYRGTEYKIINIPEIPKQETSSLLLMKLDRAN